MNIAFAQPFAHSAFLDRGVSDEAHQIDRIRDLEPLENSFYVLRRQYEILNGLKDAVAEASQEDREAFEAYKANSNTLLYTLEFLNRLPTSTPMPEIGLDRDGEFALDWDCGPRRIISVRVAKDGTLHFAWLVGFSSVHGVEPLTDNIPDAILHGLGRVITF